MAPDNNNHAYRPTQRQTEVTGLKAGAPTISERAAPPR